MSSIAILLMAILANSMAGVLIKMASTQTPITVSMNGLMAVLMQPMFYAAGFCYGAALVLFTLAVSKVELSVAYTTIVAGAMVVVTILSAVLFKEAITVSKLLGLALILVGVAIVHRT